MQLLVLDRIARAFACAREQRREEERRETKSEVCVRCVRTAGFEN
jgi:hypothetical protein